MKEEIHIFALGGLDEDGKNLVCVKIQNDIFVVMAGAGSPDKSRPGIDYIVPRDDYLVEHKDQIRAYLLLHGHDDQIGAMPFIYDKAPAPVYGSATTLKMLKIFTKHVGKEKEIDYDFHMVEPTSEFKIAGRTIHYFHTSHNIVDSSGCAIETEYGNIVFTGDFVIENGADPAYLNDMNAIAKIAEKPTLALLPESTYATKKGYTAPLYKLTPHIEEIFKNAQGRIFISLASRDLYNLDEVVRLCKAYRRKLIGYDDASDITIEELETCTNSVIPPTNRGRLDDILRLRDNDQVILMTGFGGRLFRKIALLAAGQNEERRLRLKPSDTFIMANPSNDKTEIEYTDAADEVYRTGCDVLIIPRKEFLKMHASEEDLKMMASILKPRYYIPISGLYQDMLANAMLALSMGIGLTHNNVFVMENGLSLIIDEKGARLFDEGIVHGDIMIDGAGVGDVSNEVIADRERLGEGVVLIGATISRRLGEIIAGPDIQMRGLVYGKDADMIVRDVGKTFDLVMGQFLLSPNYNLEEIRQNLYEACCRAIKRTTGKEPMVLPLIVEVD